MNEAPLEQSLALNKIVLQLLEDRKNEAKRLWAALVISILLNMAIILGVFWFLNNYEFVVSDTSVTQSADSGTNNFFHGDTEYHEGSGN